MTTKLVSSTTTTTTSSSKSTVTTSSIIRSSTNHNNTKVTLDSINEEIRLAEQELKDEATDNNNNEQQRQSNELGGIDTNKNQSVVQRLQLLEYQRNELLVIQQIYHWMKEYPADNDTNKDSLNSSNNMEYDVQRLNALGKIVLSSSTTTNQQPTELYPKLYHQEYIPLYQYMKMTLIVSLRTMLKRIQYPNPDACYGAIQQYYDNKKGNAVVLEELLQNCQFLYEISYQNQMITSHVSGTTTTNSANTFEVDDIVLELCRPFVERIKYHFTTSATERSNHNNKSLRMNKNDSTHPITSTRIDRLPELLFLYIRTNLFDTYVWDFIAIVSSSTQTQSSSLCINFINEIIRMIQWVLLCERNFFRHELLAGLHSKPNVLCQAIEEILQFDDYMRSFVVDYDKNRILSLFDVCIAGDDELLQWWLQRERDSVFAIYSSTEEEDDEEEECNGNHHHPITGTTTILPKAELFCSLLRSIQMKSKLFQFTEPYLQEVAVPLCMKFIDTVHEMSVRLRKKQLGRRNKQMPITRPTTTDDIELKQYILSWIQLINGTRMAFLVLPTSTISSTTQKEYHEEANVVDDDIVGLQNNQDLVRFANSLERLQDVLIDECVKTIMETILMERAKFASYVMRCSHFLSNNIMDNDDENNSCIEISFDLQETIVYLRIILNECIALGNTSSNSIGTSRSEDGFVLRDDQQVEQNDTKSRSDELAMFEDVSKYAPELLYDRVLSELATNLLVVALNLDGMTDDICQSGSTIFVSDVTALLGPYYDRLPSDALRLVDVIKVMKMDSATLISIGRALCGLSGQPAPLSDDIFQSDHRLYDEAVSMIRAKGLQFIELSDVLSILNRRCDI